MYTRTVYFDIILAKEHVLGGVTMAVTHLSISCSKSKNVSKQQQHHTERFDDSRKHRNEMIDPTKSKDNINLRPDLEGSYQERFENIVNSDRYKGRRKKDGTPVIAENGKNAAVKMIQVTVNIGRADENGKRLDDLSDDEITELLKNDVYPMMKEWFGGDANVIGAAIHRDESKPHLHLDIVPLTEDGKLSAKKMLGNENNMRFHQKEWLEKMQERRPDLNFQRKQNQKANGVEMEKLKELTAIAEEKGEDKAYNLVSYMRGLDEKQLNKERERIATTDKALKVKAKEVAEQEQKNDATRDELNAFIKPLKSASDELVKKTRDVDKRERELNERETTLNERESTLEGRANRLAIRRTQGRERELNERETMLNERESTLEERADKLAMERTQGRTRELDERERTLDETVNKRVAERTHGRTRELDERESELNGRVSAFSKIKESVINALNNLPKMQNTLLAYIKHAKEEKERKEREEKATQIANYADKETENVVSALEIENFERADQHVQNLEKVKTVTDEIEESKMELPAIEIDESQFDMSNQNQITL